MRKVTATTLKDVAERSGVSIMTASVVLSGKTTSVRVSDQTRQRVEEAARHLEYRPNALARSLRSNRTDTFGFYSDYPYLSMNNPFIHAIVGGLMDGCKQHGKELLLYGDYHAQSVDATYNRLLDRRIDGLVVWARQDDPLVDRLASSGLPVVAVECVLPSLPSVVVDDVDGTRQIIDHLKSRGHRRLIHITMGHHATSRWRRHQTAVQYSASLGLEMSVHVERSWLEDWESGRWMNGLDMLLDRWQATPLYRRPTAFFCWCDYLAYVFLRKCLERGLNVPGDLAIVGFDGFPAPQGLGVNLTTVRAPWGEVAQTAIGILEAQTAECEPPGETVLPVELLIGGTT